MRADEPIAAPSTWLARSLLSFLLLVLLVRLLGFASAFARDSLQMDFASFWVAGQAVDRGLSPYVNHLDADPPLWDGVASFAHSRFLYPPLAARAFWPLARLPYSAAKIVWTTLALATLAAALWLAVRLAGVTRPLPRLAVAVLAAWFLPTLALLERGQVDGFVLLAILAAVSLMRARRREPLAGVVLALAALFKPHAVYLLPFLAVRRRWGALAGFAAGAAGLVLLSLALDGRAAVADYALHQAPRIAAHGEGGTRAMALPRESFAPLLREVEPGHTVLDGRPYRPAYFRFVLNASLVQTRWARARGLPPGAISLGLLALLAAGAFLAERRWGLPDADGGADLLYWSIAAAGVLAVSPVSWAMGAVWLLPLAPLVLRQAARPESRAHAVALAVCAIGLLIAGAPDPYGFPLLTPFGERSMDLKYIVAEACCLAGAFGMWRATRASMQA